MLTDNIRLIAVTAIGHRSNAQAAHTCWVTDEFAKKYENAIYGFDFYFDDLDGKHSETLADVRVISDKEEMASTWAISLGESWSITEILFDEDEFSFADVEEMITLNDEINSTISVKEVLEVSIGNETVTVYR